MFFSRSNSLFPNTINERLGNTESFISIDHVKDPMLKRAAIEHQTRSQTKYQQITPIQLHLLMNQLYPHLGLNVHITLLLLFHWARIQNLIAHGIQV